MSRPRILCVSFDRMVSGSRCTALEEAGYDVAASTTVREGLDLLGREKFDAVIIGHRFPAEEKYVLAVEAKEKANLPVLLVCGVTRDPEIPATNRVYALEGSAGLLSALSELLPVQLEARSQTAA